MICLLVEAGAGARVGDPVTWWINHRLFPVRSARYIGIKSRAVEGSRDAVAPTERINALVM